MKRPPPQPKPKPKPNPAWQHSAPVPSKDGKTVWVDAMVLTTLAEHYRLMGVKPIPAKG